MSDPQSFDVWWHNEGSGMPPQASEEASEHVKRVARIAWSNGAYKADELRIMQLAAISTASIENSESTFGSALRCHHDYRTVALHDVVQAVQREIEHRARTERLLLLIDNFLAGGRPHGGRSTQFPDGCECDLCQRWDILNRERNAKDFTSTTTTNKGPV